MESSEPVLERIIAFMWFWIRANVEILTLGVLTLTLFGIVAYTRAAFQQAEGLLKPCLVPDFWAEKVEKAEPGSLITPIADPILILRNIGSGPALNVRYRIVAAATPSQAKYEYGSPIEAHSFLQTQWRQETFPNLAAFNAQYGSLSGKKYQTDASIENRVTVSSVNFWRRWWWSKLLAPFRRWWISLLLERTVRRIGV